MTPVPDYSLRQLSYLVAVGDAGSMRAAAERCRVTEAAVSAAVRDLERIFGVALVARRPGHPAALTQAGAAVVDGSRRLLRSAGELYDEVLVPRGSLRGQVTVGCFPTLWPRCVRPLLRLLRQEHPGSSLEVIEGGQDKLNAAVLGGACDVVLTYGTGLAPCTVHVSGGIETVRSMVAHGLGWTTLVQRWPAGLSMGGAPLVQRPVAPAAPRYSVVVAWTRGSARSRRLGAIIDVVRRVAAGAEECYRSQRGD